MELQAQQQVIRAALSVARRKEAADQDARSRRQRQATHRSMVAHLARLRKASSDYETAADAMIAAFRQMTEAAASAGALLPPTSYDLHRPIEEHTLRRLCETHLAKVGSRETRTGFDAWAPGAPRIAPGATPMGTPSLTTTSNV